MRKLISIVMVLCLLLGAAIAESAPLMTYDFGDFTMDMPEDIQGSIVERAENVPFASLYENYDQTAPFNDNVNIVWNSAVEDLSILDPEQTATAIVQATMATYAMSGVEAGNAMLLGAAMTELDGKPALSFAYSCDIDFSGAGVDYQTTLYVGQIIVSEEGMGTYTFTQTVEDLEGTPVLDAMLESIAWKN